MSFSRRGDNCVSQHLSGAGSSPAGSVGRDLNLQMANWFCSVFNVVCVVIICPVHAVVLN